MSPHWGCMTSSPFFMAKDLQSPVDLIVGAAVGGIEADQPFQSLVLIRSVRGGGQPLVHRTNHGVWNLALTGPVPGQALVQRCLQPPSGPFQVPPPPVSVDHALAPAEMRVGGIHKHVLASVKGAIDSPIKMRLQFSPGPLNPSIPPQLFPQRVAGDHPCAEQGSEDRCEGRLPTARGTDQQMPLLRSFRQRTVCRAIAPDLQSQEQAQMSGRRNRNNPCDRRFFPLH